MMSSTTQELKRLYFDLCGMQTLSEEEIAKIKADARHIHGSVDSFYYRSRPEQIANYYERYAKMQRLLREKGLEHKTDDVQRKLFKDYRYNLDNMALFLHQSAFMPAVELLASEA